MFQFKIKEAEQIFKDINHQAEKRGYNTLINHSEGDLKKIDEYL